MTLCAAHSPLTIVLQVQVGQQYRSSDDGEPGGTAGRPILAAIEGEGLDGVAVLVIRWVIGWGLAAVSGPAC